MPTRLVTPMFLAAACLAIAGCDEGLSSVTGPTPDLEPTFSAIQRDIFDAADSSGRPACTQCHNARLPFFIPGGLNLTAGNAYANLVNVRSVTKPSATRVVPGEPDNSYLVHKLEGRADIVGQRMPFGGPFLSEGQILVIKRWIALGARND